MGNDVDIIVRNETDQNQYITVFQQEDNNDLMFKKLFPIAWQVFPLAPPQGDQTQEGFTTYTSEQDIRVARNTADLTQQAYMLAGVVEIKQTVEYGEEWKYTNQSGIQKFSKLGDSLSPNSVICVNASQAKVTVDLYKNEAKLLTYPTLAVGDRATFSPRRKLSIMATSTNQIHQGQRLTRSIIQSSQSIASIDLHFYVKITCVLKITGVGGKKGWDINGE